MATKIDVDNSGNVTYQIDGEAKQTMFPNVREGGLSEEEVGQIIIDNILPMFTQLSNRTKATDVTSNITFTNGSYTEFTLIKAVQVASILFIQGSVTPTTTLSASASTVVTFNVKSALNADSRAGFGITPDKFYGVYVSALENKTTTVKIKKIDSSTWPTSDTIGVTLIIPLA